LPTIFVHISELTFYTTLITMVCYYLWRHNHVCNFR